MFFDPTGAPWANLKQRQLTRLQTERLTHFLALTSLHERSPEPPLVPNWERTLAALQRRETEHWKYSFYTN